MPEPEESEKPPAASPAMYAPAPAATPALAAISLVVGVVLLIELVSDEGCPIPSVEFSSFLKDSILIDYYFVFT